MSFLHRVSELRLGEKHKHPEGAQSSKIRMLCGHFPLRFFFFFFLACPTNSRADPEYSGGIKCAFVPGYIL